MINYSQDPFFTVYAVVVLAGVALGLIFLPSYFEVSDTERIGKGRVYVTLLKRTRGGGARLRRPSRERTRTILPWMAQETQYCLWRGSAVSTELGRSIFTA
jgi:hypothetical protein